MFALKRVSVTALVILTLVLSMFDSAVQALPADCAGGHCDSHTSPTHVPYHAEHALVSGVETDGVPGSDRAGHDGCNPFACHDLALLSAAALIRFSQFDMVVMWPAASPNAGERADTPDRPPNL